MNRLSRLVVPVAVAALSVASGCVVRPEPVVVGASVSTSPDYGTAYAYPTVPPPSPIAEYRPPPPGYGYTWVDGYWDWTGYDWAWTTGNWVPERPGYLYVRPRYVYQGDRWVYQRSYWGAPDGRRDYDWGRPGNRPGGRPGGVGPGVGVGVAPVRGGEAAAPGRPSTVWAPPVRGQAPGGYAPAPGGPGGWARPGTGPTPAYAPLPQRGPVAGGAIPGGGGYGAPVAGQRPVAGAPSAPGMTAPPSRTLPGPGPLTPMQPRVGGPAGLPTRGIAPGTVGGGVPLRPLSPSRPTYIPPGMGPGGGSPVPQARGSAPNRMGPGSSPPSTTTNSRPASQPIRRGRPPGM
jgi:hypothetical protein